MKHPGVQNFKNNLPGDRKEDDKGRMTTKGVSIDTNYFMQILTQISEFPILN